MSILEKEVWINLPHIYMKHFELMGYDIPKIKNKQGKMITPKGSRIVVKVEDLNDTSVVPLTKVCDICGVHMNNRPYRDIIKLRDCGLDYCHTCGVRKAREKIRNNPSYIKSLNFYAENNNKLYLLDEFSAKNPRTPTNTAYGSTDRFFWNCPDCNSEYDMPVRDRTNRGLNCPYCSGNRINETNCMATTHPEIIKLLWNPSDGYKYMSGSNKKIDFKCPYCNYRIINKYIYSVVHNGLSCPKCSDGVSYPNKFIRCVLDQLCLRYDPEKVFSWAKDKKYDNYINNLNTILEVHGQQHYNKGFETLGGDTLEIVQGNDQHKCFLAMSNGIDKYIIIDARKSNMQYIKSSLLQSELSNLFDLNKIDWLQCHEYACKSMVKTASDLWESREITNTAEMANKLKVSRGAIISYLKQGVQLGWCDYDPKVEKEKGRVKNSRGKAVVRLSMDGAYIDEYKNDSEVRKKLNIGNVYGVANGKSKSAGGFKWMYKLDYEKVQNSGY